MSFEVAQRATEVLLALALAQSSLEHLLGMSRDRLLFGVRLLLCLLLLFGVWSSLALVGLMVCALVALRRFQGPYNGGSDKMGVLILVCLCLSHFAPTRYWQEMALAYLAFQVTLSYFVSGQVKLRNAEWRSGRALADVFAFSAYPVGENLRALSDRRVLLRAASWAVILFEVLFPIALLSAATLWAALVIAALFHLANACLFGLNRFLWIWLAAYPSLLWFQDRVL